jgi:hypothetical protein
MLSPTQAAFGAGPTSTEGRPGAEREGQLAGVSANIR